MLYTFIIGTRDTDGWSCSSSDLRFHLRDTAPPCVKGFTCTSGEGFWDPGPDTLPDRAHRFIDETVVKVEVYLHVSPDPGAKARHRVDIVNWAKGAARRFRQEAFLVESRPANFRILEVTP